MLVNISHTAHRGPSPSPSIPPMHGLEHTLNPTCLISRFLTLDHTQPILAPHPHTPPSQSNLVCGMIRLREERAAERRRQEAEAAWRQLFRSIWTHLRLHQDYGDNAAAHAGQDHSALAEAALLREDLSGCELLPLHPQKSQPERESTMISISVFCWSGLHSTCGLCRPNFFALCLPLHHCNLQSNI